jgi:hypothetical protein
MMRRLLGRFFRREEPRTIYVEGLGQASEDRYGYWACQQPIQMREHYIGVLFKCNGRPPGPSEVSFCQDVERRWDDIWHSVLDKLRRGLADDGPEGERTRVLKEAHPVMFEFGDLTPGSEVWEVQLAPDIYGGHLVTAVMRGFGCKRFRLDG